MIILYASHAAKKDFHSGPPSNFSVTNKSNYFPTIPKGKMTPFERIPKKNTFFGLKKNSVVSEKSRYSMENTVWRAAMMTRKLSRGFSRNLN